MAVNHTIKLYLFPGGKQRRAKPTNLRSKPSKMANPPLQQSPFADRYPLFSAILFEQRERALTIISAGFMATYAITILVAFWRAGGPQFSSEAILGGDFIVFWSAAKALWSGDAAAIYASATMEAQLLQFFPNEESYRLSWQYPPTAFLLIGPLGALGYLPALFVWWGISVGLLFTILHNFWARRSALVIALGAAAVLQGLLAGQTGLLTASALALAAFFPGRRPLLAGLAAGLLTVKPQFGILLPIAYIAGGHWRAFFTAAITASLLVLATTLMLGPDIWTAFYNAITAHSDRMQSDIFPFYKVISLYGGMVMVGIPIPIAIKIQLAITLGLAIFIFWVWRRHKAPAARTIALCIAAPLAVPYVFYYELAILVVPCFLIAKQAMDKGWLRHEQILLSVLWLAPLFVTSGELGPLPIAALSTSLVFFLGARRLFKDERLSFKPAGALS